MEKISIEANNQEHQEKFKQEVGDFAGKIFDTNKGGEERFNAILVIAQKFIKAGILDENKFIPELKRCSEIEDKNQFINQMLIILEPVLETKKTNPILIEEIQRDVFLEQGKFIKLNEVLSYGISWDNAHIHFAPAKELRKEMGIKGSISLVKDGLKKLAKIVEQDEKIKKITATSWIVTEMPTTMERLGFTITGLIGKNLKDKHFKGDKRDISQAEMPREKLLEYLKKE